MPAWQAASPSLVLASGSATRRQLLEALQLEFEALASDVDEASIKREKRAAGATPGDTALALAEAKAHAVGALRPDALVIGADQILSCDETWFDKPADLAEAHRQLSTLRARAQTLHTATVFVTGGRTVWRHLAEPRLVMRAFGDEMLEAYLAAEGEAVLFSVGACRVEGPGLLLFETIAGEQAAILGLPMLAVTAALRARGILLS